MFFKHTRLEKKLREHGRAATAEILHAKTEGSVESPGAMFADDDDLSTGAILYRLKLRVMPEGEPPFEVTVHTRSHTLQLQGETVPVVYDPDDHRKVVVEYEQQYLQQVEAENAQAAPAAAPSAPPADADASFAELESRIKQLEDLHKRGVLTDAELAAEQAKAIDAV